jgi:hypothetical protein
LNQQKSREDNTWISNSSLQDISLLCFESLEVTSFTVAQSSKPVAGQRRTNPESVHN